jgi:hypothetical protein
MPTAYIYDRNGRFYCTKSTLYSEINNTANVATISATDACKHGNFTARPKRDRIQYSDKEATAFLGHMDQTRQGRFSGTASVTMPLFGASGTGVAPDHACILESAFGKATAQVYTADSVTRYLNETTPVTCELWGFNTALRGVCAYGALVNRLRISAGGDNAELSADFICYCVLAQDRFAAAITPEKGDISAWPDEPATQTYTGSQITGFTSAATVLDGHAYTLRNVAITMNMNRAYRMDKCAIDGTEYFPSEPYELMPEFLLDISIWNTDSADLSAMLAKLAARTAFDGTIVIGSTAGGIYTFTLKNFYKPGEDTDPVISVGDDNRQAIDLSLRAQCTAVTARDEISLTIT